MNDNGFILLAILAGAFCAQLPAIVQHLLAGPG